MFVYAVVQRVFVMYATVGKCAGVRIVVLKSGEKGNNPTTPVYSLSKCNNALYLCDTLLAYRGHYFLANALFLYL